LWKFIDNGEQDKMQFEEEDKCLVKQKLLQNFHLDFYLFSIQFPNGVQSKTDVQKSAFRYVYKAIV
jgi:hypothetical protein